MPEIKDITYTDTSASCIDLQLDIDSNGRLRTKQMTNDKRDAFDFPIICGNIPSAYGLYIFQLIRYSRACGSYNDFLDRGLLLTRKLLYKGLLLVKLKSSLRKIYGRHNGFVDRYETSVSQMTSDVSILVNTYLSFPHS